MATKEEQDAIKECFTLYDRDNAGRIPCSMLGTVLRSLGAHPTERDIQDSIQNVIRKDSFGLGDLMPLIDRFKKNPGEKEEELREACRVFDRDGNGYVSAAELKHIMTNIGEKLSDQEVNEMIQEIDVDGSSGLMNYEELVQLIMGK